MFLSEVANAGGFFNLVPLIVFIPLLGLVTNIIFGDRLGEKGVGWLASGAAGLAFVIALLQVISLVGHPEGQIVHFLDWITIGENIAEGLGKKPVKIFIPFWALDVVSAFSTGWAK